MSYIYEEGKTNGMVANLTGLANTVWKTVRNIIILVVVTVVGAVTLVSFQDWKADIRNDGILAGKLELRGEMAEQEAASNKALAQTKEELARAKESIERKNEALGQASQALLAAATALEKQQTGIAKLDIENAILLGQVQGLKGQSMMDCMRRKGN